MQVFQVFDVNDAYARVVNWVMDEGVDEPSRNGMVKRAKTPICVEYAHPTYRVLFNQKRDCNPFFHLFECIWMMAGRRDAEFVSQFASTMTRYAESDGTFHGAYGYRWRYHFGRDQLKDIVDRLKANPYSRRAVLAMHDARVDNDDSVKDQPCNTHIYFQRSPVHNRHTLEMTVCNRSNDIVWGMLGANAVHMSFLQEYIAAALGWGIGVYRQVANNAHIYIENEKVAEQIKETWNESNLLRNFVYGDLDKYAYVPICDKPELFLTDCEMFCDGCIEPEAYHNKWFSDVALPMLYAWRLRKEGSAKDEVLEVIHGGVKDAAWCLAGSSWVERRK